MNPSEEREEESSSSVKHLLSVQKERSDSPALSDWSLHHPPEIRASSSGHNQSPGKKSDLAIPSCPSMKSEKFKETSQVLKDGGPSSGHR
ncbi:hypothetical protein MHYP_G00307440 [Metynnis hypsauchen]